MRQEKRWDGDDEAGPGIGFFALIFSFLGCMLGAVIGKWLAPISALMIGCVAGILLGWWAYGEWKALDRPRGIPFRSQE